VACQGSDHLVKTLRNDLEMDVFGDVVCIQDALQEDTDVLNFIPRKTLVATAFG